MGHTLFRFRIPASTGSTYAAVLPDPVLALHSTSLPSSASGMALRWTSVGERKPCCATACTRRASSPRSANVVSSCSVVVSGFCLASGSAGTSFWSSLRFMAAIGHN